LAFFVRKKKNFLFFFLGAKRGLLLDHLPPSERCGFFLDQRRFCERMVLEQRFGLIVAREACTVVFVPGRYTSQRRDDDLDRARTTNPALPELSWTHAPRFTFRNFFDDDLDLAIFFLFFFFLGNRKKKWTCWRDSTESNRWWVPTWFRV
jgi:hypothetical protein